MQRNSATSAKRITTQLNNVAAAKEAPLEPLFYARSPAKIKYAKQPPRVNKAFTEIPTETFAREQKFQWTDSVLAPADLRDALWDDTQYPKKALSPIEARLHNPLDSLIVCEIDKEVGKGVFLSLDAAPIPPGTVIGIFAGKLMSINKLSLSGSYRMLLTETEHKASPLAAQICGINGELYGNITRYIQDLPDVTCGELPKDLDPKIAEKIASANLAIVPGVYKGCPISFLATTRTIQPGEQLGYSYEKFKFAKRCVFNTDGKVIGHFTKTGKIEITSAEIKDNQPAPKINLDECKKAILPLLENPAIDTFDHEEQLVGDLFYILDIYGNRYRKNSIAIEYINQLKASIEQAADLSTVLSKLADAKDKLDGPVENILQKMQNELMECVKKCASLHAKQSSAAGAGAIEKRIKAELSFPYRLLPRKKLPRELQHQVDEAKNNSLNKKLAAS